MVRESERTGTAPERLAAEGLTHEQSAERRRTEGGTANAALDRQLDLARKALARVSR
jgi:hypothetical protein